ncbi:MAG: class I SAM-dependent methyltransferase [Flavobacteriales bacterium]|nr:class I SAM-dependent methyltransferase [Flavobacteriales bacterium]MDW8432217.1 SAM-dependent methyltransferase [Flavobacteriales bacterium]
MRASEGSSFVAGGPLFSFRHIFPSAHYALLDSGDGLKLERFGEVVCIRPEPQAIWKKKLSEEEWSHAAHVMYRPKTSHSGFWEKLRTDAPDSWHVQIRTNEQIFRIRLALTAFKHVGVFPEQADNWAYILERRNYLKEKLFLNLFGYTGAATLAAALATAHPVHVDAVKQVVRWAADNAALNHLGGIRWIVDDALSFVRRELRRGRRYAGIIMDPPAYGHGPRGESWKLEEHLGALLSHTLDLLEPGPCVYIANLYSLGYSPTLLCNTLQRCLEEKGYQVHGLEYGELRLAPQEGYPLPAGIFARFDYIDKKS